MARRECYGQPANHLLRKSKMSWTATRPLWSLSAWQQRPWIVRLTAADWVVQAVVRMQS